MSDSRITQVVANVTAIKELLTDTRNIVHELLEEDPSFAGPTLGGLQAGSRELFRSDITATSALSAFKTADALENWRVP